MDVIVKRLHELKPKDVRGLGRILKQVQDSASSWACVQFHMRRFWSVDALRDRFEMDADPSSGLMCWVGIVDKEPVGLCHVAQEQEDYLLAAFLLDLTLTEAEQWEIADAIALCGLDDVLALDHPNRNFYSHFNRRGWAADYATRCGFRSQEIGTYLGPDPDPNLILRYEIGVQELRDNIAELQSG